MAASQFRNHTMKTKAMRTSGGQVTPESFNQRRIDMKSLKRFLRLALGMVVAGIVALLSIAASGCTTTGSGGGAAPHEHGQEGKEHPNRPR